MSARPSAEPVKAKTKRREKQPDSPAPISPAQKKPAEVPEKKSPSPSSVKPGRDITRGSASEKTRFGSPQSPARTLPIPQGGIKTWVAEERPREKMEQKGVASLTNAELLAILLRTGSKNHTAVDLAKTLLHQARNDLSQLSRFNLKDIQNVHGIGLAKAVTLTAALELGRRRQINAGLAVRQIRSSEDAADILRPMLSDKDREYFCVLYLNNNNRVLHHEILSTGGLTGTTVDIRLILKTALQHLSCALIISHNHPSGQLTPSEQDIALTERLNEGADLVDIVLMDHLIITENGYMSFIDAGLL